MVRVSNCLYSGISYGKPEMCLCGISQFRLDGVLPGPPAFPLENYPVTWIN